jgi:hypothetical protein
MSTIYAGTIYSTIRRAARAWALSAAPDGSIFGDGDSPASEARALRIYWDCNAVQSQGSVDLPTEDGETVDEDRWIEKREVELETLIGDYIASARLAREDAEVVS